MLSAHDLLLTVLQIELKEAVDDIEAIAATPGVDVLFIGPLDLTISLGVPLELHSEVAQQALRQIEQAARTHGKAMGILLPDCESVPEYVARGYQFIGISSDGGLLNQAARSIARTLKTSGT